jgi:hypothetical protein
MKKKTNPRTHQVVRPTPRATRENDVRVLSKPELAEASGGGDDRTYNIPNV